jgi:adenine-specific DNA-methyltransferase
MPLRSAVEEASLEAPRSAVIGSNPRLGQFFTPEKIARFMAGMFAPTPWKVCRLLDPGAGMGALSTAFFKRWDSGGGDFSSVEADAFEIDES